MGCWPQSANNQFYGFLTHHIIDRELNARLASNTQCSVDLTAAARIRDAVIELFGEHNFEASLRAIAEAGG